MADDSLDFDPSKKKRRRVKVVETPSTTEVDASASPSNVEQDYTYSELLARVYASMSEQSGSSAKNKKTIEPPTVGKVGSKRTAWMNFTTTCHSIKRDTGHVMAYILTELGGTGSIDGRGCLIIKGRFTEKAFESVLTKYIKEYVTCSTCHFLNTEIKKENRVSFKHCKDCGATSSVSSIRQGFSAQMKRKKE